MAAPEIVADSLSNPEGMAMSPNGKLIVAETGKDQLVAVDLSSGNKEVLINDIDLGAPGIPNMPPHWKLTDIQIDENGVLYVASDVENKVYKYTVDWK